MSPTSPEEEKKDDKVSNCYKRKNSAVDFDEGSQSQGSSKASAQQSKTSKQERKEFAKINGAFGVDPKV